MTQLTVGVMAPAFTALNQDGETVALKDFIGQKVVLYFYPKAMTPGCTVQACSLRDSLSALQKFNLSVVGVSPDQPERLKRFADKEQLQFTLVADIDHSIAQKYGVWGPKKFMGKTFEGILRTTFIVDEQGNIIHILDKVNTKTHHESLLSWLQEHSE